MLYTHANFISSGRDYPGTLADTDTSSETLGFLSFVRLVGSVYFTKNKKWFTKATPEGHFNSTVKLGNSPLQNHLEWLDATYSNEDLGENSIFGKRTAIRKCSSISLEQVRMGTGHVETITPECC